MRRSSKLPRLTARHFLTADLSTGFALLREAADSLGTGQRSDAERQIGDARTALEDARRLLSRLQGQDVEEFAPRVQDLERAIEGAEPLWRAWHGGRTESPPQAEDP